MKTLIGTVAGLNTPKTAKVLVERQWQHPIYKKSVNRSKVYACHIEGLDVAVGDHVEIAEHKPMSRTKHFIVTRKIEEVA